MIIQRSASVINLEIDTLKFRELRIYTISDP